MASRVGAIWHHASDLSCVRLRLSSRDTNFKDLRCMSFTSKNANEVLVAGQQDTMFKIDVEKGTIVETV
jgi:hypothetical protein